MNPDATEEEINAHNKWCAAMSRLQAAALAYYEAWTRGAEFIHDEPSALRRAACEFGAENTALAAYEADQRFTANVAEEWTT